MVMKQCLCLLILAGLFLLSGCGGNKDKDVNKDLDRPRPANK